MDVQPAGLEQGRVAYRGKIRFGDINLRFENHICRELLHRNITPFQDSKSLEM